MSLKDRIAALTRDASEMTLGLVLSAVWLALVALFWLLGGDGEGGGIGLLLAIAGVVSPLVLIWMAVALAGAIAGLRAEADELRLRLTHLREAGAGRGPAMGGGIAPAPATSSLPADPARARIQPAAPRSRAEPRPAPPPSPAEEVEAISVPPEMLVRALNFPDGPEDTETIVALRTALKDQDNSRVLRAAQDVITLLAGHDLFMDDLPPDAAPIAAWRRFAEGARGNAVAQIGGIRHPLAIEFVQNLLRQDEIFRDSAHHFLRHFDVMLTRTIPQLEDEQIGYLGTTRSARAFMLLGRAAGLFGQD